MRLGRKVIWEAMRGSLNSRSRSFFMSFGETSTLPKTNMEPRSRFLCRFYVLARVNLLMHMEDLVVSSHPLRFLVFKGLLVSAARCVCVCWLVGWVGLGWVGLGLVWLGWVVCLFVCLFVCCVCCVCCVCLFV